MAEDLEDFNSSDIEFELSASKHRSHLGAKSIEEIIAHAAEDRLSSKKTIKNLEFGRGAPGTLAIATLWMNRFNNFRQHTLRQDITTPFTGDDLLRFFDAIIDKLRPKGLGKPVVSSSLVKGGLRHLLTYGTFTYSESSGYKISKRDSSRLSTWLDDAIKSGRLIHGKWKKAVWINYTIMSRLCQDWLNHFIKAGTQSWDVILAKYLSVLLISSIGSRSGDVTRSKSYKGDEYLKYKDITLVLEGDGEPKIDNLRAMFVLEYSKGKKRTLNDDDVFYLRPLHDSEKHMCIVSVLLIHALRHGLVYGTTVQEVLEHTIGTPDSSVQWRHPNLPVTAAISNLTKELDLESVANAQQPLKTIKQMGIISNILVPLTIHSTRYGAAQDAAHLSAAAADGVGFTNDNVRQVMGHKASTLSRGLTEMYAGKHTQETFNLRSESKYVSRFGPKFSEVSALDSVKAPVSNDEIIKWQMEHEPDKEDHQSKKGRDRARDAIRRQRHTNFLATAPPEKRVPLSDKPTNTPSDTKADKSVALIHSNPTSSTTSDKNIDPALLDDEDHLENADVDSERLDELLAAVLPTQTSSDQGNNEGNEGNQTGGELIALEELLGERPLTLNDLQTKEDFITFYSRINKVKNMSFARAWSNFQAGQTYDSTIGPYSMSGNSRESADPFLFSCHTTVGCPFTSVHKSSVVNHETVCNQEVVQREIYRLEHNGGDFKCTYCGKNFILQKSLTDHIQSIHEFSPTSCPLGCDPRKVYQTAHSLYDHTSTTHSGRWPTLCAVPDCEDTTQFSRKIYDRHLKDVHQLTTAAARKPFLPARDTSVWHPVRCPIEDCSHPGPIGGYELKKSLIKHLMKTHEMERKEARELATSHGTKIIRTREVKQPGQTHKRPWKEEDVDEDSEDEDNTEAPRAKLSIKRKRDKGA